MPESRRLSIGDYDDIIGLWKAAGLPFKPLGRDSREFMAKEMALSQVAFFGLRDQEVLIAVGIANYDGRRGWVNRVAVLPEYRRKNIAGQIIEACEVFLEEQGSVVICALIEKENEPSVNCFNKAGYALEDNIAYFTKRRSPVD